MTVATTVLPASLPWRARCAPHTYMMVSPSHTLPYSSTAMQRSASPSKAKPTSSPSSRTYACRRSMCVEPQPLLMLKPSGSSPMT